jgi:hypothetical protein
MKVKINKMSKQLCIGGRGQGTNHLKTRLLILKKAEKAEKGSAPLCTLHISNRGVRKIYFSVFSVRTQNNLYLKI